MFQMFTPMVCADGMCKRSKTKNQLEIKLVTSKNVGKKTGKNKGKAEGELKAAEND